MQDCNIAETEYGVRDRSWPDEVPPIIARPRAGFESLLRFLLQRTGARRGTLGVATGTTLDMKAAIGFETSGEAVAFANARSVKHLRIGLSTAGPTAAVFAFDIDAATPVPEIDPATYDLLRAQLPILIEVDRAMPATPAAPAISPNISRAEVERYELESRFTQAFDNAPLGMTIISADPADFGLFTRVNRAYCALIDRRQEEVVGKYFTSFLASDERAPAIAQMNDLIAGRLDVMRNEVRLIRRDDSSIWVRLTRSLMRDGNGRPICFFTHLEDISQRRADQIAIAELNARLQRSLNDAPIGMALTSIEPQTMGRFIEVNPALSRITGLSRAALETMTFDQLLHPDGRSRATEMLRKLVARELATCHYWERCMRWDGSIGWLAVHGSIAYDAADRPMYCITQIIDITKQKEAESKLEHLAYHDALTGVLNRRGVALEVKGRFGGADGDAGPSAVLLVNLDHFRYVNDTMGHAAGDGILIKVAAILRRMCPGDALIARLDADEFLVVLGNCNEDDAVATASTIGRAIQANVSLSPDTILRATASIGIVLINDWSGQKIDDAIAAADAAAGSAKAQGRNRSCVAASLVSSHTAMHEELTWSQRIRSALERNEFALYAQPILNLRTGIVERFELLLRMVNSDGTVLYPSEFLAVAERTGLILEIDRWVIKRSIEIALEEQRLERNVVFEVNLSGASLTNEAVMAFIEREMAVSGLDPRFLVFEITETAAIENMDEACHFAERISALGCAFALDDFGSGFSSFYYLKYLPFSDLKIDGEFIRNLTTNASDQHIVRAIVEVARGLGKATIAEFVGDAETAVLLQSYGVDYAQGYFIGKPLPWEYARSFISMPLVPNSA